MGNGPAAGPQTDPKVMIQVLRGRSSSKTRELKGTTLLVGSDAQCDVQMRSVEVAPKHCLIQRTVGRVKAQQLDPNYPVLLNGAAVEEATLADGDKLTIGPFEIGLCIEGGAPVEPAEHIEPVAEAPPTAAPADEKLRRIMADMNIHTPIRAEAAATSQTAPTGESVSSVPSVSSASDASVLPAPADESETKEQTDDSAGAAPVTTADRETSEAHEQAATVSNAPDLVKLAPDMVQSAYPEHPRVTQLRAEFDELRYSDSELRQEMRRREREVLEQARQVEESRKDMRHRRERMAKQRTILEQTYKDQAERELQLNRRTEEIQSREVDIRQTAQELETRRVDLTEALLEYDRSRQVYDQNRGKFYRLRRRLVEQYRRRRAEIADAVEEYERQLADAHEQKRQLDRETELCGQTAKELGQRRVQVDRQATESKAKAQELARREQQLVDNTAKLEQQLNNVRIKERTLERLGAELDRRKEEISKQETETKADHESARQELDRAQKALADANQRLNEAEGKKQVLEKQENHLKERARELEAQRVHYLQREQELARQSADIEEKDGVFRANLEQLQQRERELGIREGALEEQTRLIRQSEQELARLGELNAQAQAELNRRTAEFEKRAQVLLSEFQSEREQIESQKLHVEQERQASEQDRQQLNADKQSWVARTAELRELSIEAAESTSIAQARQRRLRAIEAELKTREDDLREREEICATETMRLDEGRGEVQALLESTSQKAIEIRQRAEELDRKSRALDERQEAIVQREEAWCNEVERRRAELEESERTLKQERAQIDRQSMAQRRHTKKFRDIGAKMARRRKQAFVQVQAFEQRCADYQKELDAFLKDRNVVRGAVQDCVDQATQREHEMLGWMQSVGNDKDQLAHLRLEMREQLAQLSGLALDAGATGGDNASGEGDSESTGANAAAVQSQLKNLEQCFVQWAARLAESERCREDFERDLAYRRTQAEKSTGQLNRLLQLVDPGAEIAPPAVQPVSVAHEPRPPTDVGLTWEQLTTPKPPQAIETKPDEVVTADATVDENADVESAPEAIELPAIENTEEQAADEAVTAQSTEPSNERLIEQLVDAEIADEDALRTHAEAAGRDEVALPDKLVAEGVVTQFQLDCLANDRTEDLRIGAAAVLDLVHRGSVATVCKVRVPNVERPVALRLLDARLCRDQDMRNSFKITAGSVESLQHENIAAGYGFFETDDRFGSLVELVDGKSIEDLLATEVAPEKVVGYCTQAVRALSAAHSQGLFHGNLRPGCVRVTDGVVKLLGYGEPEWLNRIHRCERPRKFASYAAPELSSTESGADVRDDVYALGKMFLELATGTKLGVDTDVPELSSGAIDGYPKEFGRLLMQMAAPRREDRCQSVKALLSALESVWHSLDSASDATKLTMPTTDDSTDHDEWRRAA